MCCLKYEQEAYEDLLHSTPAQGSLVATPDGRGMVTGVNLLSGILQVHLDSAAADAASVGYSVKNCKMLRPPLPRQKQKKSAPKEDSAPQKDE